MKSLIVPIALGLLWAGNVNAQEDKDATVDKTVSSSNAYFGLELFDGENTVKATASSGGAPASSSEDLDGDGFRLKIGARLNNDFRIQAYFKRESIETFYNDINGFGVDLIKAFKTSSSISPYIQAGFTLDSYEIEDSYPIDYTSESILAFGVRLGFGGLVKVNDNVEIVGGFDWQNRNWEEAYGNIVNAGNQVISVETSDTSTTFLLGLNIHL